jgi:hypothetical protein
VQSGSGVSARLAINAAGSRLQNAVRIMRRNIIECDEGNLQKTNN